MDNYLNDPDFVEAIVDDYALILKTLDFQIRALEELERIDKSHPFLKTNNVKDLYEMDNKYKLESEEFNKEIKSKQKQTGTTVQESTSSNTDNRVVEEKDSVYI